MIFNNIQVGDKVIVVSKKWTSPSSYREVYVLSNVDKVNKKTLSVDSNLYNLEDGKPSSKTLNDVLRIEPFSLEKWNNYENGRIRYETIQKAFKALKNIRTLNYKQAKTILEMFPLEEDE